MRMVGQQQLPNLEQQKKKENKYTKQIIHIKGVGGNST